MNHDTEQAKNLKLLLCVFEQLSGLKINFYKSELFCYGEAKHCTDLYTQLFGCEMGSTPFRYIEIPMNHQKLNNSNWNVVIQRFEKKLSGKKEKYMPTGGRLVLINLVLSSLPLFTMSFFEVPKEVLKRLDSIRSHFY